MTPTTTLLAELESLFGLPAHPLVVHAAVVLVPLSALGVVAIAFWPAARRRIGWIVVALAFVGLVSAWFAKESGEPLEDQVPRTEAVHEHAEMGDSGAIAAAAVFVGAAGVMGLDEVRRRRARTAPDGTGTTDRSDGALRTAAVAVGVVAVVLAGLGTFRIVQIGHSGSKAVWEADHGTNVSDQSKLPVGGDDDGDRD